MTSADFEYLLNLIGPSISKQETHLRKSIPARERLAVTLRFLASGDGYQSLSYLFKMSPQVILLIIIEVCETLKTKLSDQVKLLNGACGGDTCDERLGVEELDGDGCDTPRTSGEWQKIADVYEKKWNFPNCIGALNRKHVVILSPINSGGTFSIVLMVLCDADYNITYANIGSQGRISDGGVFRNCTLSKKLKNGTLNLPIPKCLPQKLKPIPYVIVADNAFPLQENLLSRARRTVENVFGIMSAVFRILRKPILLNPNKTRLVTECCVLLHNFLRRSKESKNMYTPPGTFDMEQNGQIFNGSWRNECEKQTSLLSMEKRGIKTSITAKDIGQEFAEYFIMTTGKLEWQDNYQF
ncbi:protein ANTAGONIST OF LIKE HETEROCHROMATIN PROTEIN 1-like [Aphis craccivora]|uniref:Protein ANTAGONIST OF LIKE HETEROCHROMATIN PROTEIN 1-like n=1 Tax=Aphis craccivora TaxID=307492 RepID=A0A6G0YAI6_APHCR|nr:protein ANTAGONIST OF LIKE HETEROCHROMATIN PROTEIN 1-like [Aphis craccivora]